jgi:hypothetical protein
MATLYDYFDGDVSEGTAILNAANDWAGQSFTTSIAYTISRIDVWCAKGVGDDVGNIVVALYETDGSGHPTGSVLASGTIANADIPEAGAYAWVTCTLDSSANLDTTTKYCIVVHGPSCNASNVFYWRYDDNGVAGGSSFAGGDLEWSTTGGVAGGWSTDTTADALFRCYGGAISLVDKTFSKQLIAVGNHEFWYESTAGTMEELTTANGEINTSRPLEIFEAYEKVFIVNGANKKVADFGNIKITTTDIKPAGKVIPIHGDILTGGTSTAEMIVDYIDASDSACNVYGKRITAATFVNADVVTGTNDNGDVSFTLNAAETTPPHWYDWTVYANDTTTYGTMPDQVNAGCLWRGRGCLSADKYYPQQWYMTRQGSNMWDFNYISNDAQSPVAGGGDPSVPGQVGDIVIVQIPYDRDHLIFGCSNSIYCMFGDPAAGGSLDELDIPGGILGTRAWCKDKDGNFYMLVSTGLIRIPKGFGSSENLTELSYPDFIKDLAFNPSTYRIVMGYDRIRHGIKIVKVTLASGANTGWWYDLKAEALFPESYASTEHGIFSMFNYEATNSDYKKLLLGCNNGYIYYENDDATDDALADDSAQLIDSYITFGPIKLGEENREGKVNSLVGVLAGGGSAGSEADSDNVAFKIWTELSADKISERFSTNSGQKISGTIKAPGRWRGNQFRRSVRGMFAGIRIGNSTAGEVWGLERLLLEIKRAGRMK